MFGVTSFTYGNERKSYHYKNKKKFYKTYQKFPHPTKRQNHQPYDIRLVILRHAERIDIKLGATWYEQVFGGVPSAPPESYQNPLLPYRLPYRAKTFMYQYDPPIIRDGQRAAMARGQQLARLGISVDYCYSSPACRCVLTANGVLNGMNSQRARIALEPVLFEPMNWNPHLQQLPDGRPFLSKGDWINAGYHNIDKGYTPIRDSLYPLETENDFYRRSQLVFHTIEQDYDRNRFGKRPTTILLSGHAGTPVIYPIVASGQKFDAQEFGMQCGHIPFLHTVILERNAMTRHWSPRPIPGLV